MPQSYAFLGDLTGNGYGEFIVGGVMNRAYLFSGGPDDGDGDGYPYYEDCVDTDSSIHPDAEEVCGDGIDNNCDGFGLPEDDEDGDGLSSEEEEALGTAPCTPDTDGDGVSDGEEVEDGTDPLLPPEDTAAPPGDTAASSDNTLTRRCGCASSSPTAPWAWLFLPLFLLARRALT